MLVRMRCVVRRWTDSIQLNERENRPSARLLKACDTGRKPELRIECGSVQLFLGGGTAISDEFESFIRSRGEKSSWQSPNSN
jgi:hypothetical protein